MNTAQSPNLVELNDRSREIFRRVVENYIASGDPVGSRTLTRSLNERISAATVRNVMQDLEFMGLLGSPHTSAGRIPTQMGLRMFVDGMLEIGSVGQEDRQVMDVAASASAGDIPELLDQIGATLSGVTKSASIVLSPKTEAPVRHIEFISLSPEQVLVVLVFTNGHLENRLIAPPVGMTPSAMREAANFLNAMIEGKTLSDLRRGILEHIHSKRREIDSLAQELVDSGIAIWQNQGETSERLIVRGRANLLDGTDSIDLDRIRQLFDDLERKRDISEFLELTDSGEGVRIFIGSENKLFSLSGSSFVVSPYMNADRKIIGAVGVIGPTRLNYGRIVPIVDYTAQIVSRLMAQRGAG